LRKTAIHSLQKLLLKHHGEHPVLFKYIDSNNTITRIKAGDRFSVNPSEQLTQQIKELLGTHSVFLAS